MHTRSTFRRTARAGLAALSLLLPGAVASAQAGGGTYIALGDSYAYGFTTVQNLLNPAVNNYYGIQGYVAPLAAYFGAQNTVNLALPGETTASFLAGGNADEAANFNYPSGGAVSQSAELAKVLAGEAAQGHAVSDVTVQLGGNDLLGAVFNNPAFFTESYQARQAFLAGQLAALSTNEGAVLQSLHGDAGLSQARVFVVGYFDPFADLGANDPFGLDPSGSQASGDFAQALNGALKAQADALGFTFVDPYAAFRDYPGNHDDLSYIKSPLGDPFYPSSTPNFHPKAAGYALYAQQIEAAAVPESASAVSLALLLALGLGGIAVSVRRKTSSAGS